MKKILFSIALFLGFVGASFAAAPTQKVTDAMYGWSNENPVNFDGTSSMGTTFGKFNKVHSDSAIGASASKILFTHFVPSPGYEYILCRDTLGSFAGAKRDTSNIVLILNAYMSTPSGAGRLVGTSRIDSMGGTGNGTKGSVPQQVVLPFAQTIIGDYYDLKLQNTTAKDSVYYNYFFMKTRSTRFQTKDIQK